MTSSPKTYCNSAAGNTVEKNTAVSQEETVSADKTRGRKGKDCKPQLEQNITDLLEKHKSLFDIFPSEKVITIKPPDFRSFALNIQSELFSSLQKMNCSAVIAVDTPANWFIRRKGAWEKEHIDMFFINSGSMILETPDKLYNVTAGKILIIPSWIDRCILADTPGSHIYVRFNTGKPQKKLPAPLVRNCISNDAMAFYTKQLLVENLTFDDESNYRHHMAECLTILLNREMHPATPYAEPDKTEALLNMLQTADYASFHVNTAAKQFGMSLSAFRNFCLSYFGKPPSALIEEIRMSRARALLQYDTHSIEEIAMALGYSDRFSFSKAFVRYNKTTPVNFRHQCMLINDSKN